MAEQEENEFVPSITREEINALPLRSYEGRIHLIRSHRELKDALVVIKAEEVLGFDTETKPAFKKGTSHLPALIQMATSQAAYLFQVRFLDFPNDLLKIFSSAHILKAGVALYDDIKDLKRLAPFDPAGFIDLSVMATEKGISSNGLRALTAYLLGFRISKAAKISNWAKDKLSEAQISYAATDAWVSREIYLALQKL